MLANQDIRKSEELALSPAPGTTTSRRLKTLTIAFALVRPFLSAGDHSYIYTVIKDAVPDDAVLVNIRHAWPNCIELLIYSESFDEVDEGAVIPTLTPVCLTRPTQDDALKVLKECYVDLGSLLMATTWELAPAVREQLTATHEMARAVIERAAASVGETL
jgi:hypothetical protein